MKKAPANAKTKRSKFWKIRMARKVRKAFKKHEKEANYFGRP